MTGGRELAPTTATRLQPNGNQVSVRGLDRLDRLASGTATRAGQMVVRKVGTWH